MSSLLFLILGLGLLVLGGELFVNGATHLALRLRISSLVIGLTVVAFGTSAPELAVSLKSSIEGSTDISVGNIVGSNIFNILVVLGFSSLVAPLTISMKVIKNDVVAMILVTLVAVLMALDGTLGFGDGVILLLLSIAYFVWLFKFQNEDFSKEEENTKNIKTPLTSLVLISLGLVSLVLGTDYTIDSAKNIATYFGVSERIIGVTIIAGGTSLPELVTSIVATYRGQRDIAIGNVIGSNILNILVILGPSAIVAPNGLSVQEKILEVDFVMMAGSALICIPVFLTGKRISRFEGAFFLGLYCCYLVYLLKY